MEGEKLSADEALRERVLASVRIYECRRDRVKGAK